MGNVNTHGSTWKAVQAFCEAEIAAATKELKDEQTGERRSDILRGRLQFAEQMLGLPDAGVLKDGEGKPITETGPETHPDEGY